MHSRESLTLICIFLLEVKNTLKFIQLNIFNPEEEIFILALEKNDNKNSNNFKFASSKYSDQKKNLIFSQNDTLQLRNLESELSSILKNYYQKDNNFSVSDILDNLFDDLNSLDLEAYFFTLFESAMGYFSKHNKEQAAKEFKLCKIYYEIIILIRVISCDMNINEDFESLTKSISNKDYLLFTFIGNMFKKVTSFEQISERYQTESYLRGSNQTFDTVISFYREINKMLDITSE